MSTTLDRVFNVVLGVGMTAASVLLAYACIVTGA